MKRMLVFLLFVTTMPAHGESNIRAESLRLAIDSAVDAMELHNSVAGSAEMLLAKSPTDLQRRNMELLSVVLGSYRIYYKQYCGILQELSRPERAGDSSAVELWNRLATNRGSLESASAKVAKLAAEMGIALPPKWQVVFGTSRKPVLAR